MTTPPTATTPGRGTYTATFENEPLGTATIEVTIDPISTITITFNAGEGTVDPASVEIEAGAAIGELPVPELEGWKFIGWFTEPAATFMAAGQGTAMTSETTFDESTEIYAHWRLPGDINGDGVVSNKDVTRLQKYLKGDEVEVMTFNLDTNGDGSVSNKDLTRLQKYLKGDNVELN